MHASFTTRAGQYNDRAAGSFLVFSFQPPCVGDSKKKKKSEGCVLRYLSSRKTVHLLSLIGSSICCMPVSPMALVPPSNEAGVAVVT